MMKLNNKVTSISSCCEDYYDESSYYNSDYMEVLKRRVITTISTSSTNVVTTLRRRHHNTMKHCALLRSMIVSMILSLTLLVVTNSSIVDAFTIQNPSLSSLLLQYQQQQQQQRRHQRHQQPSLQNKNNNNNNRNKQGRIGSNIVQQSMMFDQLSEALTNVVTNAFGNTRKKKISETSIVPALKSVRRALIDADVNINVADALIDGVKRRILGQTLIQGVTAEQQFIKAMYDELVDIMGGGSNISSTSTGASTSGSNDASASVVSNVAVGTIDQPAIILLAGLQGAGKTTIAGKLALYFKEREVNYDAIPDELKRTMESSPGSVPTSRLPKRNRSVLIIAADVYRPAAIQQLQVLGERVGVEVFTLGTDIDPVEIVTRGIQYGTGKFDTIIVDTAGRQVIDTNLMKELQSIKTATKATETLLIVDAMTGQEAATLTAAFDDAVGITGAVLTKMDGDVRGGAAVSVRGVSGKPIKFIGIGEKVQDLEPFYPDRMASRILGMGDVISLVEKAAAEVSEADAMKMQQRMRDASFDFDDFLKQSELVTKMGSVANIAKMMPGIGNQINMNQIREVEVRLQKNKAMICSMTPKERQNPDLLITDKTARSRIQRITRGSGLSYEMGQQFISEFQRMRTMMSRMQKQMTGSTGIDPGSNPLLADGTIDTASVPDMMAAAGNRASRRSSKKNSSKKGSSGRGFGGGFS